MVAPELADPLGALEVGEHEDVEQFGAGSRPESVEACPSGRSSSSGRMAGGYASERARLEFLAEIAAFGSLRP